LLTANGKQFPARDLLPDVQPLDFTARNRSIRRVVEPKPRPTLTEV